MPTRHLLTTTAVGVICALAGATAGIADSAASTPHTTTGSTTTGWSNLYGPSIGRDLGFGSFAAIQSESVEPTANGSFDVVTVNAGTITATGASSLTIKEGTKDATYGTPTITPHGTLTVTLDGKTSTLSALAVGDRVLIAQSSSGTSRVSALTNPSDASTWTTTSDSWGPEGSSAGWGPGTPAVGGGGYGPGGW